MELRFWLEPLLPPLWKQEKTPKRNTDSKRPSRQLDWDLKFYHHDKKLNELIFTVNDTMFFDFHFNCVKHSDMITIQPEFELRNDDRFYLCAGMSATSLLPFEGAAPQLLWRVIMRLWRQSSCQWITPYKYIQHEDKWSLMHQITLFGTAPSHIF